MNNKKMLERFDQAGSAVIQQLFWIAGSLDTINFRSLIEDLDDEDWKELFPEIHSSKYFESLKLDSDSYFGLVDYNKLGFIAEVLIPERSNFIFEKGEKSYLSCTVGPISHLVYVYAETTNELIKKIEAKNRYWMNYDLNRDKKKGGKK